MSRKKLFKEEAVVSCRFDLDSYRKLKDIASLETIYTGVQVSAQDLIRYAVDFVYADNERLREALRKMRSYGKNNWN